MTKSFRLDFGLDYSKIKYEASTRKTGNVSILKN